MSHSVCGKVFEQNFENLAFVRDVFRFYQDFCYSMRLALPGSDVLEARMNSFPKIYFGPFPNWNRVLPEGVPYNNHRTIVQRLGIRVSRYLSLTRYHQETLGRYADKPEHLSKVWDHSKWSNIKARWEEIQTVQARMNAGRVEQLKQAADLLEANPDILKQSNDPAQKRRPNIPHQTNRMNATLDLISRSLIIRDPNPGASYFRYLRFPVVPFDDALNEVAEALVMRGWCGQQDQSTMKESKDSDDAKAENNDVASIRSHVETLINGAGSLHIYSPQEPGSLPEAQPDNEAPGWTLRVPSLTRTIDGVDQSVEMDSPKPRFEHKQGFRQPERPCRTQVRAWAPHDEKELEWLKAFVEVYRFLERG
ncbi:hypothetical protein FQN54_000911 [Arachnomyces sp. PD_36]|nr:hypothetical protein FQN54_000911 [Arachnomyces sp. PD_36]